MMNTATLDSYTSPASAPAAGRTVLRLLGRLRIGTLGVTLPDGNTLAFGAPPESATRAAVRLHNWKPCAATLKRGDIGFAEGFIDGDWSTSDLVALLELFMLNRRAIEELVYGRWWGSLLCRFKHAFHRNTRAGSERNIHAHYDLGNDFYRLWLDDTMNYSSAWFEGDHSRPTAQAQWAKVRRVLRECGVAPGQRVLEVGCGWGALAECAVREFGVNLTGLTLSREQLAWGPQRLSDAGLSADLRDQDYRDLDDGPYDAIVSIEMFEAVGREYWADFFGMLRSQLKPGGQACVQSIVIRDDLFERYARSTDFIQQYIFPGGLLPSRSAFQEAAQAGGLRVVRDFSFGHDYAETLRRWRERFLARGEAVRALGFDERFMRIWEFYLAYCEAAFSTGNTDVVQFTLSRD